MIHWRNTVLLVATELLSFTTCCGGVGAVTHGALQQHNAPEATEQQSAPNAPTVLPAEQSLQVALGQAVVLPCILPFLPTSLHAIRVYWSSKDASQVKKEGLHTRPEEVVHVFNKGQEDFEYQSPTYRNRTRLFTSQLQSGNFSLELRSVSEHDNLTTFQCLAIYDGIVGPFFLNNVSLLMLHKYDGGENKTRAPPTDGRAYWFISIPAALAISVVLLLAARHKCNASSPDNNTDPERGEGPQLGHWMAGESTVELERREEGGGETELKQEDQRRNKDENGGEEGRDGE